MRRKTRDKPGKVDWVRLRGSSGAPMSHKELSKYLILTTVSQHPLPSCPLASETTFTAGTPVSATSSRLPPTQPWKAACFARAPGSSAFCPVPLRFLLCALYHRPSWADAEGVHRTGSSSQLSPGSQWPCRSPPLLCPSFPTASHHSDSTKQMPTNSPGASCAPPPSSLPLHHCPTHTGPLLTAPATRQAWSCPRAFAQAVHSAWTTVLNFHMA